MFVIRVIRVVFSWRSSVKKNLPISDIEAADGPGIGIRHIENGLRLASTHADESAAAPLLAYLYFTQQQSSRAL